MNDFLQTTIYQVLKLYADIKRQLVAANSQLMKYAQDLNMIFPKN